jgi:hypothetical protein
MGVAVSITRLDLTASELRKAASGEKIDASLQNVASSDYWAIARPAG